MLRRSVAKSALMAGLFAVLLGHTAGASQPADPVVRPALDGFFAAFEGHPLVGIAEVHNLAEEGEFYTNLVADPRFASKVGNVVVEFGSSAHQDILDRYLAGEEVPYSDLRRVWSDVVGWVPTVTGVMYQTFFAQVRSVNQKLAPERRIRVWLGEPAINWSVIHTRQQLDAVMEHRDEHPAQIIEREILAKGKKALVIYGSGHFTQIPLPSGVKVPGSSPIVLRDIVERTHPGAFYVVTTYVGYPQLACSAAFEAEAKWPKNVLIAPIKNTPLQSALMRPGCPLPEARLPGSSPAERARIQTRIDEAWTGISGDALLYLRPAAELTQTPTDPTLILDEAYFREIERRVSIMGIKPPSWGDAVVLMAMPPQPFWPR